MKIGVITYNNSHLKTTQVLDGFFKKDNNSEYIVFSLPFILRKQREILFEHRPKQDTGEHTTETAKKYGMRYIICDNDKNISGCDFYIICGAGILSPECINGKKIINCHSGIIPEVRGLDAFKWAIYNLQQVGNTLHYINEKVDEGEIIGISITPIYEDDTLKTFANRHYEREIEMLINYDEYLKKQIPIKNLEYVKGDANRRMPIEFENMLEEKFEKYKREYGK